MAAPPASDGSRVAQRWGYPALAALLALLWLALLPLRPLFNPDEGRYAEIPREMLSGGDWVIPHLNGVAYIEKPPLQYWATALSLRVFGDTEFGARFYTALTALGTVLVVWGVARRMWGVGAAWRASGALISLLLFVVLGQLLTLDMSLTFYMTVALGGFLLAQRAGAARCWMLVAWVASALGVLTKGVVAAAIPAAVLVIYSVVARDFSPWRRLWLVVGLPVFLGIAVPWHVLAARRLPDFLQFFFVHEHLARYLTPSADREEAWWFFGVVFLAGGLPWTLAGLRALALSFRRGPRGQFNPRLFLGVWVVFVLVFFSLSDSKLIPYILPAMPAVALLVAALPIETLRREVQFAAHVSLGVALGLGALCLFAPRLIAPSDRSGYFLALASPFREIVLLLVVSGLYALSQRGRDVTRAMVVLSAGWCLAGLQAMRAAAAVAPVYSGIALATALAGAARDTPLYSVGTYDQTLPFYLQRTVTLVAYRGELDYGVTHAQFGVTHAQSEARGTLAEIPSGAQIPGVADVPSVAPNEGVAEISRVAQNEGVAEIPSVAEFLTRWSADPQAYAVMEIGLFDDLKSRGVPMRELGRNVSRVVVARR